MSSHTVLSPTTACYDTGADYVHWVRIRTPACCPFPATVDGPNLAQAGHGICGPVPNTHEG